jgi:hypothetical protein
MRLAAADASREPVVHQVERAMDGLDVRTGRGRKYHDPIT